MKSPRRRAAGCNRLQWREDGRSVLVSAAALRRRLNTREWTVEMYKRGLIGTLEILLLGETSPPPQPPLVITNTFRARRKRSNRREVRWLLVINSLTDIGCVYHPECRWRRAKIPTS